MSEPQHICFEGGSLTYVVAARRSTWEIWTPGIRSTMPRMLAVGWNHSQKGTKQVLFVFRQTGMWLCRNSSAWLLYFGSSQVSWRSSANDVRLICSILIYFTHDATIICVIRYIKSFPNSHGWVRYRYKPITPSLTGPSSRFRLTQQMSNSFGRILSHIVTGMAD